MRTLTIDVTDLGGKAQPGDTVVLWKPDPAGSASAAGRIISTAPVTVRLVDGKASVPDVEPGPMRVHLRCRGLESTAPVTVTVPDGEGTVTLRSLFESQFEYEPPIVSAVQQAADNAAASERAAVQAQVRSEDAADRAETRVDEAINNGAELVRDEVKQDADRAVAAKDAAQVAQSSAEAAAGTASTAAADAAAAREGVDEAAAAATAAAGVVQEATEPLPQLLTDIGSASSTGLSQIADARASALSALDAKSQQSLVPRVDTTVGTRVFAGDVMVYGESGWRNITSLLVNGWKAAQAQICRTGNDVIIRFYALDGTAATAYTIFALPPGFFFAGRGIGYYFGSQKITIDPGPQAVTSPVRTPFGGHAYEGLEIRFKSFGWPTTLPGTPL